jgi:DNA-binding Lrp family transcriptional regulator
MPGNNPHEVVLYIKSRKVVTAFHHANESQVRSRPAEASAGGPISSSDNAPQDANDVEVGFMLPDEQSKVLTMVEEITARRGYNLKVVDVGKTNPITQFVETRLRGVENFPVLEVVHSHRRLEGPESFNEDRLCAVMPTELKLVRVFSYLKVKTPEIDNVQKKLLNYDEVKETHLVTGDWDVLAILEFPTSDAGSKRQVLDFIIEKMAKIPGVEDTSTLVPDFSMTKFPL